MKRIPNLLRASVLSAALLAGASDMRANLLRDPIYRRPDPTAGGGRPVLLIPGFLAGDETLAVMSRWLVWMSTMTLRGSPSTFWKA